MTGQHRLVRLPVTTLLSLWVVMLVLIGADWVLSPLGAFGSPATIVGVGCVFVWMLGGTIAGDTWTRETPLRFVLLLYAFWSVLTFIVSMHGPTSAFAIAEGLRAFVFFLAAAGPCLLAAEVVRTRQEVARLVGVLVTAGAVAAIVGLVQFRTELDLSSWLVPPGLEPNEAADLTLGTRSIFTRPKGTAQHPIEFGVVMAMIVPLAVWYARVTGARTFRGLAAWIGAALIGIAALASVSRSAVLTLGGAAVVMFWRATWRERFNGLALAGLFIGVSRLFADGLLGTLLSFFRAGSRDDSITGRTDDFGAVADLVTDNPITGVGWGRFNPTDYFYLDNQLLDTLIESGLVGLALLLAIPAVAVVPLLPVLRRVDDATSGLGTALVAAIIGGSVTFATFDTLSFRQFYGIYFLLVGLAVTSVRLEDATRSSRGRRYAGRRVGPG